MDDNKNSNSQELWKELKKFLNFEIDYIKLTATEKLTIILSSIAVIAVVIILGGLALFYLSFSFAYLLAGWTGSLSGSFLIVSGIILFVLLIILMFRRNWILNPISRFISKLFLDPPTK